MTASGRDNISCPFLFGAGRESRTPFVIPKRSEESFFILRYKTLHLYNPDTLLLAMAGTVGFNTYLVHAGFSEYYTKYGRSKLYDEDFKQAGGEK